MREKIYLKVGKGKVGYKFSVHRKPSYKAFDDGYFRPTYFPTVLIPLVIEIPNGAFSCASKELEIKIEDVQNAIEVEVVKEGREVRE